VPDRALDGGDEGVDRAAAGLEGGAVEQEDDPAGVGLGHDDRGGAGDRGPHRVGLVVTVEGVEGDGEAGPTGLPVRLLAERAVGDVAERAVRPAEAGTDPVRQLAPQGVVGVVHAHEAAQPARPS
jgi:hypothetical protein